MRTLFLLLLANFCLTQSSGSFTPTEPIRYPKIHIEKSPPDKTAHYLIGGLISSSVSYLVFKKSNRLILSGLCGIGAAFAVGYLKEFYDARKPNKTGFNMDDLAVTAFGGTTGFFGITVALDMIPKKKAPEPEEIWVYEFKPNLHPNVFTKETLSK